MINSLNLEELYEGQGPVYTSVYNNRDFSYDLRLVFLKGNFLKGAQEKHVRVFDPIHFYYERARMLKEGRIQVVTTVPKNSQILDLVKTYLKEGMPITLSNFRGENWFLIENTSYKDCPRSVELTITAKLISSDKAKKSRIKRAAAPNLIFPLNQYDRGFENEDLFKFCHEFCCVEEKLAELKAKHDPYL